MQREDVRSGTTVLIDRSVIEYVIFPDNLKQKNQIISDHKARIDKVSQKVGEVWVFFFLQMQAYL